MQLIKIYKNNKNENYMKIWFKTLVLGCLFIASSLHAQVPQELIDKAKAAGMTDAQIQQEIEKRTGKQSAGTGTASTSSEAGFASRRNPMADRNRTSQSYRAASDSTALYRGELTPAQEALRLQRLENTVFGSEIFKDAALSFEPDLNLPTPKDYRLAAGDEVIINVWGASEMKLTQKISPDGFINIPSIGPVGLSGLTVDQASIQIKNELGRIMSGLVNEEEPNTFVSVSLGQIRSIKVHLVGEVIRPGSYTLPSLATLFNALYAAGGVNDIGTLRNIKVYRNSKEVASLDVYDYLLNGKFDSNIRLEDNDMIIVGTYDNLITVRGKVKRKRIFELKKGETMQNLINYSGGFTGDAYTGSIRVIRKAGDRYSIATVDKHEYPAFSLMDKDSVMIDSVIPMYTNRLQIKGAVWREGEYELGKDISTIKELVSKAGGVKGDEFTGRAQLTRMNPDFTKEVVAIDIRGILNGTAPDLKLKPEDELYIPSLFDLREAYTINVRGAVNNPDTTLMYRNNMTVEDAIISAGGLREAAAMVKVEVARRIKNPYSETYTNEIAKVYNFTLAENLQIVQGEKLFTLEPFDEVIVRFSPGYQEQQLVDIEGEVLFTGSYVLSHKNERLSDLVKKAGGVSNQAYIKGASLKRKLTEDEMRKIETMITMSANKASRDSMDASMLNLNDYSVGIDLQKALKTPGGTDDIVLRDGDKLFIPQYQSTVKVSGAVTYPNSVTYTRGMSVRQCLAQAGGYTDISRKYPIVIYMNGKVATTKRTWIFFKKYPKVEPGAEILVPMKKQNDRKMSIAEVLSIGSSATSMAAMVTSVVNMIQNNKNDK